MLKESSGTAIAIVALQMNGPHVFSETPSSTCAVIAEATQLVPYLSVDCLLMLNQTLRMAGTEFALAAAPADIGGPGGGTPLACCLAAAAAAAAMAAAVGVVLPLLGLG